MNMEKNDSKDLKKRYLIWLYKTAKEAWDRIERKFTQLDIDKRMLKELKKLDKNRKSAKFIDEFEAYIKSKEIEGLTLKYENNDLKADYNFLALKLKAVEKAILKEFGNKGLQEIKSLYEKEMVERILKSTEVK